MTKMLILFIQAIAAKSLEQQEDGFKHFSVRSRHAVSP